MNKFKKILVLLGLAGILLGTSMAFSEPGTGSDPLVSLSYLEKRIEQLRDYIDERILEIEDKEEVQPDTFQVVEISAGQSIIGKGGTEIILRGGTEKGAGKATVIASGNDGLSDITEGKDLKNGEEVPLNHLLIVPRDDGRGVYAVTDSVYLVKGDYEIR